MHNAIQHLPIPLFLLAVTEDATAQDSAVEFAGGVGADADGDGGVERLQEVWGGGAEVFEDLGVAVGAGEDDAAGEEVGVDDGEVVGGGVEEG